MEKFLAEKPNTLEEAVQLAKSMQMTKKQVCDLESNSIIAAVTRRERTPQTQHRSRSKSTQQSRVVQPSPAQSVTTCNRWGQVHRKQCPHLGIQCKICKKKSFASVCFHNRHSVKNIHDIESKEPQ